MSKIFRKTLQSDTPAAVIDSRLVDALKNGVGALIADLPPHCHHTVSGLRVRVRDIMRQANLTPQVVQNAKTHDRYVLLHEDVFAQLIESLGDPVAALMNEFAARGRSAALPETRPGYRELRVVEAPNIAYRAQSAER